MFSCPQIAIRKYMGISMTSQKKKNRNRSMAVNTPTTPAITQRMLNWKKPWPESISSQEETTATMPRNIVSATSRRLNPSISSATPMPNRGIHGQSIAA